MIDGSVVLDVGVGNNFDAGNSLLSAPFQAILQECGGELLCAVCFSGQARLFGRLPQEMAEVPSYRFIREAGDMA